MLLSSCQNNTYDSILESIKDRQKIFLIDGQSNAFGVPEVYEYDSVKYTLEILQDLVGQDELNFQDAETSSFIPPLSYIYNVISQQKVIAIQAAIGGVSIIPVGVKCWENWIEQGQLWNSSVYKTENAHSFLKKSTIDAIIWSQGENDGEAIYLNLVTKQDYKNALIRLINRYHEYLGEVPFIIVETGRFQGNPLKDQGYKSIREAQREVAAEMDNVYIGYRETEFFIERDWLKDVVHYNQEALNDIGKKLAYFYASLED